MLAARKEPDLDGLLAATDAAGVKAGDGKLRPIPRSALEVASCLRSQNDVFTAGGVFTSE